MFPHVNFSRAIFMNHIIHFKHFSLIYYVNSLEGTWVHRTCQGKKNWYSEPGWGNNQTPIIQSIISLRFFPHKSWSWGQKVAYLVLCPPFQMFCKVEYHGEWLWGRQEVWIGVLSCMSRIFLLLPDFPHITLMEVIWDNQLIYKSF